jgi:hypothetical protein
MVVRPCGQSLDPWPFTRRLQAVLVSQEFNVFCGQRGQYLLKDLILNIVPGPVKFKKIKQEKHVLKMLDVQAIVHVVKRMGYDVHNSLLPQIRDQIENIVAQSIFCSTHCEGRWEHLE